MKVYEIDIMSVSIFVRFLVRFHVCFIGTNEGQNDQCNVSVDAVEAKNYSILGLGFASFHNHAEVLKGIMTIRDLKPCFFW